MSTAVSIRLSDDIAYKLGGIARIIGCFRTYIISKSLESYFREYVDYSVATERLNDKDDEIVPGDEMRDCIAL